jgi:hypothetical protein
LARSTRAHVQVFGNFLVTFHCSPPLYGILPAFQSSFRKWGMHTEIPKILQNP